VAVRATDDTFRDLGLYPAPAVATTQKKTHLVRLSSPYVVEFENHDVCLATIDARVLS
jgi:hypothetical protein